VGLITITAWEFGERNITACNGTSRLGQLVTVSYYTQAGAELYQKVQAYNKKKADEAAARDL